MYKFI